MVNRFYHFVSVVVTDWAYWIVFDRVSLDDNEWKAKISNFIKEILLICLIHYFKPFYGWLCVALLVLLQLFFSNFFLNKFKMVFDNYCIFWLGRVN